MSFFSGFDFFVVLIIALIPAILLGLREKSLRFYRMFLTGAFIFLIYHKSPQELLFLLSYAILALYVVKLYGFLRARYGRNKYIYGHAVLIVLIPLIISKIELFMGQSLLGPDTTIYGFLGLSYIFFRVVQTIMEIYDGVIKDVNGYQFLTFLLFFPSLSSGPIDRSRRFFQDDEKIYTKAEYNELLEQGIVKIVLGLVYKLPLSGTFLYIMNTYMLNKFDPLHVIGYAYFYGFYMFFDFAGYSLMAIGTSYILGIKMPDNFNKPFISIDMKDFWNRWHITLSHWFRDFVFTRFIIDSARKRRFNNRLTAALVGLLLNMTLMGIWHGLEAHYILYGVYHGVLLGITEFYQKKSKFYKIYKDHAIYKICSWFVTLNAVMLGFLIFSGQFSAVVAAFTKYLGQ
ncbi:D-alanyl-lipoteichoic acid biosynthesis protein DltB [Allofustis seminis]|uniref:D-alanyl-lipoteichoic acid biosynthesis protein DltB n=1 Tax=Allofustis seminis TaxID=166939 RepID=UPI0003829844|nr:D-alanyl-lipoteichoic acid biosynthesis protein DltB [Allofustis seminis]